MLVAVIKYFSQSIELVELKSFILCTAVWKIYRDLAQHQKEETS